MEKEKLNVKVVSHIRIENHVEYLINIENVNLGYNIFITEKYLNLRNLYESMKKEFKGKNFPQFPPNKLFGYEEENFVIQRAKDLNSFFTEIMSNNTFSKIPSFKNYIASNIKKNSQIIKNEENNNKRIGKSTHNKKAKIGKDSKFQKRAKLFSYSFFKMKKEDINNFNENNKEIEDIKNKFVSINYEIEININPKNEEKYKNIFDENNFNIDVYNNTNISNGDNNNFDIIGKNNDYIESVEKNLKIYMGKNLEKLKSLKSLGDVENFFLK